MHGGDVISHVNITSVRVEDGGTYQCIASNRVGEVLHEARLNVYGKTSESFVLLLTAVFLIIKKC